jgi:acyl carrier protein
MSLVQLILGLEERFGLQFPIEELELDSFRSLSNIAELVFNRKQLKAIGPQNG